MNKGLSKRCVDISGPINAVDIDNAGSLARHLFNNGRFTGAVVAYDAIVLAWARSKCLSNHRRYGRSLYEAGRVVDWF